jgi:hypothetical protein
MWHGKAERVVLNANLTRYHRHLTPGTTGVLVPNVKTTMYGWQDRFGAVRFDCCGATLDIVLSNLTIDPKSVPSPKPEPKPGSLLERAHSLAQASRRLDEIHAKGILYTRTHRSMKARCRRDAEDIQQQLAASGTVP